MHVDRLKELVVRNEALEAAEDPDWSDRAALDLSPAFKQHRLYPSAKRRELQRTPTNDTIATLSQEATDAADRPGQGRGVRQRLAGDKEGPEKSPNNAKLEGSKTQSPSDLRQKRPGRWDENKPNRPVASGSRKWPVASVQKPVNLMGRSCIFRRGSLTPPVRPILIPSVTGGGRVTRVR